MEGQPSLKETTGFVQRNRGAASGSCLLFILIIVVILYSGFKFGMAYWTYFGMQNKTREALVWAAAGLPKSEGEIAQKVILKTQEFETEIYQKDVKVSQTPSTLTVKVSWVYDVVLPVYTFPMKFRIAMSEGKRWR